MRRIVLLAAAFAIPASALSVALTSGPASAASGPTGKSVCTSVTGSTVSGTITISGCTDSGGATTGGGSQPVSITALAAGGTVMLLSGDTVTFAAPHLATPNAHKCPGYSKTATTNPVATKFQGQVTGSTAGLKIPGKISGEVCVSTSGNITALKPLKLS